MHYVTVFEVGPYTAFRYWWIPAAGLAIIIFVWRHATAPGPLQPGRSEEIESCDRFIRWFAAIMFTIVGLGFGLSVVVLGMRALRDVSSCQVIEGRVRNFQPLPAGYHGMESFDLGDQHFEYSDNIVGAGFNQTLGRDGPIREGLPVRICHTGATILRLETGR